MVISVGAPQKCPLVSSNLSLSGLGILQFEKTCWGTLPRCGVLVESGSARLHGGNRTSSAKTLPMSFRPDSYLLAAERIAERHAKARHPRPREFDVVMDSVIVCLRPEENIVPEIKTNATADVAQEMVGGRKIRTGDEGTGEERLIEPGAGDADSTLQLKRRLFPQRWRVNSIEVIKDGTKRLDSLVCVLFGPPVHLEAESEVVPHEVIGAKARKCSAAHRLRLVANSGARGRRRRDSAHREARVELLRASAARDKEERACCRDQNYSFQVNLHSRLAKEADRTRPE